MDELLPRLAAALAERYTFEGQAGQGGMATVYRATDLKHHRPVAIKVLRPELAATIGSDRFLREIEMAARLQHPHIVPLYDSGSAGSILYYVMPFVEGESLRQRLTREGHIPFEEAVTLTREVASALAYAHAQGIVHRDIKPENIMLSGGHAVVTDFGIARALNVAAGGQQLTGLGFAIGTPAYMSPEQATASEVDARSDQYALACVFYEMVTGDAPFAGPTVQAVLTRSLTGPRPRMSRVNRTTPPEADAPVTRALSADPGDRFPGVMEFADALQHAAGGGVGAVAERRRLRRLAVGLPLAVALAAVGWILFGPTRHGPVVAGAERIAVLPFTATGPGVSLLGEGMVDLLSTNLNAVGGIRAVEPRAVLARWKKGGGAQDLESALAVASDVKASAALVGSIVATGSQVRLSADLYDRSGKNLGHAQVDGVPDSVLSLVDSLSLALVREIWRSKEPVPSLRVASLTTGSLAAMREYLVGEQHYRRAEWDSAAAAFGRAVDQDSTFALAQYRLAMALGWRGGYATPRARQASEAALRFASRLPPRDRALVTAYQLFSYGKLAAVDSMQKYVAAYPDDVEGWNLLGETQYHTNHLSGRTPAELTAPFARVLALDSSLTPSAIHPMEIALAARDSAGFSRYLAVMRRSADPDEYRAYAAAGRLIWPGEMPDSGDAALLARNMGVVQSAMIGLQGAPDASGRTLLTMVNRLTDALARGSTDPAFRLQMATARGVILDGFGRFDDARTLADSLQPSAREQTGAILLLPMLLGIAPPDLERNFGEKFLAAPIRSPFQAYLKAIVLLNRGRGAEAERLVDSTSRDSTHYPEIVRGALQAVHGWRLLQLGDTTTGVRDIRVGLERFGGMNSFLQDPVRFELAAALAARPQTQEDGLRLLRNGFYLDLGFYPLTFYALGRAAESAGRRDEALAAYGQFVRLWDGADSAAQGRVKEAKDAMARLAGEPRS
jgi:tRNA A-37 threonylcarbamoyl transferase component Bud32/tetratricopeptide (TPR) repeat protein/TolB-like protein